MSRVLVIDDDPMILKAVSRELRAAGWEVITAGSPTVIGRVDIALLDVEPYGAAMAHGCLDTHTLYVFMTGNDTAASELRAAGNTVIAKPWAQGELDAALRAAINKENRSLSVAVYKSST